MIAPRQLIWKGCTAGDATLAPNNMHIRGGCGKNISGLTSLYGRVKNAAWLRPRNSLRFAEQRTTFWCRIYGPPPPATLKGPACTLNDARRLFFRSFFSIYNSRQWRRPFSLVRLTPADAHAKRSQFEVICGGKLFLSHTHSLKWLFHIKRNGNRVTVVRLLWGCIKTRFNGDNYASCDIDMVFPAESENCYISNSET